MDERRAAAVGSAQSPWISPLDLDHGKLLFRLEKIEKVREKTEQGSREQPTWERSGRRVGGLQGCLRLEA
jgi:hypothetical protein